MAGSINELLFSFFFFIIYKSLHTTHAHARPEEFCKSFSVFSLPTTTLVHTHTRARTLYSPGLYACGAHINAAADTVAGVVVFTARENNITRGGGGGGGGGVCRRREQIFSETVSDMDATAPVDPLCVV